MCAARSWTNDEVANGRRALTLPPVRTVALAVVGLAIAVALAWNAGEQHYSNCVEVARAIPDERTSIEQRVQRLTPGADSHDKEIQARIRGCSRLP